MRLRQNRRPGFHVSKGIDTRRFIHLRWLQALTGASIVCAAIVVAAQIWLPGVGSGALLLPSRHRVNQPPPEGCADAVFDGNGILLKGWTCQATNRRAILVYLHGVAANRTSAVGIVQRFVGRGFDVVAYDSRAHGESDGRVCTYGFFEKEDLRRVLDALDSAPIVLFGTSLGAAVALLEASDDLRVRAVVAAETFSDLRTVASERAPFFFTSGIIDRAFHLAEREGHFEVDRVSPEQAAARLLSPVLLVHGAEDTDTPPTHSQRVFAALRHSKRLILVPGARHNGSLRPDVMGDIERWIDGVLAGAVPSRPPTAPASDVS